MDYKIVFIDEEIEQQEIFARHFKSLCDSAIVSCEFPLQTVDEMQEKIWSLHPDAIVTDFRLNEIREEINYVVTYDGIDLLNEIRAQREGFPCFVITSFDDQAVDVSADVNLVYDKSLLLSSRENETMPFALRVTRQIDKYRTKIENARQELAELISNYKPETVDLQYERRIIELDGFLEKALGAENPIPSGLKQLSNLNRLNKLIGKVDELLAKVQ